MNIVNVAIESKTSVRRINPYTDLSMVWNLLHAVVNRHCTCEKKRKREERQLSFLNAINKVFNIFTKEIMTTMNNIHDNLNNVLFLKPHELFSFQFLDRSHLFTANPRLFCCHPNQTHSKLKDHVLQTKREGNCWAYHQERFFRPISVLGCSLRQMSPRSTTWHTLNIFCKKFGENRFTVLCTVTNIEVIFDL